MKKLLILAGARVHCKVVEAAKEMGIYTIVTDYLRYEDSPAKQIADEAWDINIMDVDRLVEKCREAGVDGVLNFCIDPAQKPYQQICDRLGLPCIGTAEQFEILTDKRRFKEFCQEHNVDIVQDYNQQDIEMNSIHYPVFVKPTESRGSRGQYICWNRDQVKVAVENARAESSDGRFLCERYMRDTEDAATAFFVVDGEPYLVKFGDRVLGKEEDNLNRQVMCTLLPSVFSDMFESNVYERVKNMIKALGIKYGPVFIQGFVENGTVRFYDPGLRMPGSNYDLMLKAATGFDTIKSMIHFALTGDTKTVYGNIQDCYRLAGMKALLFTVSVRPGKIGKIEGFDEIMAEPYTIYGFTQIAEGTEVPPSGDINQRVAEFGILLPDNQKMKEYVKRFYDVFKVWDDAGNDMIVSRITENNFMEEYYK